MSKNSLLLVDPVFKADASVNCHLLLKITNNSFSYAIVDSKSGYVNVLFDKQDCEDIEKDLTNAFSTDSYLTAEFDTIKAAINTSNFIFMPTELIEENDSSLVGNYLGHDGEIYTKTNPSEGFSTFFCVDSGIKSRLPNNTVLYPQSAPLIALSPFLGSEALLIDFTSTSFNVLYVKDKTVHFQNHYQCETVDEFNYYLLLIIEQLGLTDAIPVYLQGIINEDDENYSCLLKYFNQLYFFLPVGNEDSDLLTDMPIHYFSGLLALGLCE